MTFGEVVSELERLGTEQNRKIYARHGVSGKMSGLSFANLKVLGKKMKTSRALAEQLWASGNHDARMLAVQTLNPKEADADLLETWVNTLDNYIICDAFSAFAGKTRYTLDRMKIWTQSDKEWIGAVGWNIMAHLAMKDQSLDDAFFDSYLDEICQNIHRRKNRVRYSMNNALIAIGIRNEILQDKALQIAKTIGKVEVDHGETGCKTPDAHSYIIKTVNRKKQKQKK